MIRKWVQTDMLLLMCLPLFTTLAKNIIWYLKNYILFTIAAYCSLKMHCGVHSDDITLEKQSLSFTMPLQSLNYTF